MTILDVSLYGRKQYWPICPGGTHLNDGNFQQDNRPQEQDLKLQFSEYVSLPNGGFMSYNTNLETCVTVETAA
jgi:hypothetical protein